MSNARDLLMIFYLISSFLRLIMSAAVPENFQSLRMNCRRTFTLESRNPAVSRIAQMIKAILVSDSIIFYLLAVCGKIVFPA